jgi:4-amino-4-deoxy-L-arabinose transferase-like glycosyltransferase
VIDAFDLGEGTLAPRLASLLPNIAIVFMLVPISRRLDATPGSRAQLIAPLLFAISPIVVQNSILIDFDTGLLAAMCLSLVWVWFALGDSRPVARISVTAAVFAVSLWVKLTTPPMVFLALWFYHGRRGEWRLVRDAAVAALAGAALFVATHLVYSAFTGYSLADAARAFTWDRSGDRSLLQTVMTYAPQGTGLLLFWVSLPMGILWLVIVLRTVFRWIKGRLTPLDAGVILSLGAFVFYTFFLVPPYAYPRYQAVMFPFMAIAVAGELSNAWNTLTRRVGLVAILLGAFTFAYILLVTGDPLYNIYLSTYETTSISSRLQSGLAALVAVGFPVGVAVAAAAALALRRKSGFAALLWVMLAASAIGTYLATDLLQVTATYSTRYRYGYSYADREAATRLLRESVPPDGFVLLDKDMLWNLPFDGEQVYGYMADDRALLELAGRRRVDALSWTDKEWIKSALQRSPEAQKALADCYKESRFGRATVLIRAPGPDCRLR